MIMKKNFLLILLVFPILANAQNVSKQIDVITTAYYSYSSGSESVKIIISNKSYCNIIIGGIIAYKTSTEDVFYVDSNDKELLSGSSITQYITYSGNFLEMGGWIVKIDYLNSLNIMILIQKFILIILHFMKVNIFIKIF